MGKGEEIHTLLTALSFGASGKGGDRIPTVGGLGREDIAQYRWLSHWKCVSCRPYLITYCSRLKHAVRRHSPVYRTDLAPVVVGEFGLPPKPKRHRGAEREGRIGARIGCESVARYGTKTRIRGLRGRGQGIYFKNFKNFP